MSLAQLNGQLIYLNHHTTGHTTPHIISIHMKKLTTLIFVLSLTLSSCFQKKDGAEFALNGTWALECVVTPEGTKHEFPHNNTGWLRIYDDSCYYECQIVTAPNGTMVMPSRTESYTMIERGKNEYLYLQDYDAYPLTIKNDSAIVIQQIGCTYTWKATRKYEEEKVKAIIDIIKNETSNDLDYSCRYVFSNAERELKTYNHTLIYVLTSIILALLAILHYVRNLRKNKKRVEQELLRIEQEQQAMPRPVREAMDTVEEEFHNSDFYISLRKKMSNGERLSQADWDGIDDRFKSIYPRFTSTLLSLHSMSQVEMQVCHLLKLNASPSEIANVLCKDVSTISSIRSRLYMKVFGKKGSSKDWDEFIRSL